MKKQIVFVLVKWGRVQNSETPLMEVVGVYSTKTAAKEKLTEERENIKAFFAEEYEGENVEEYGENNIENWGIQVDDYPVFQELLITEKEVDYDERV